MKIIVDSACDYKNEMKNDGLDLESVPLSLQVDETQYVDDDSLDIDNYLSMMEKSKVAVRTAAPSPDLYLEQYKSTGSGVFAVTISKFLSASYQNAMLAKQMYLDDIGEKFIHVFDSLSASVGETLVALKLNELLKVNLPNMEIVEKVSGFIQNMRTYFVLEKYDNLVKNGRISPYIAAFAKLLSIRPICASNKGDIVMVDKVRGSAKALRKLVDIIAGEKIDFENRTLAVAHVRCKEKAIAFRDEVLKRVPFKSSLIMETGGLCTTYAQRDGLIVAY